MKGFLISIGCILILLLGIWMAVDRILVDKEPVVEEVYENFEHIPAAPGRDAEAVREVVTPQGTVTMRDVRTIAYATSPGEGFYHFEGTVEFPNSGFSILYSEHNDSFAISLYERPLELYHENASKYFLELTELNIEDACKLNVFVSVTYDIDPELAGKDFGLTYCEDGIDIPE